MLPYHLKFPQEISLITVVLDDYGNNYQLLVFPESNFNVCLKISDFKEMLRGHL